MLFLDFDGTLVDLWPRFHAVFCALSNASGLTLDEYKRIKQKLARDEAVAGHFEIRLREDYFQRKKILLESKRFLKLDKPFWNPSRLNEIFRRKEAILLTKRRYPQNLRWELNRLRLRISARVLSAQSKAEWIQLHYPSENSIIIGDSLADLEAAALPNVTAVMVEYGLETSERFQSSGLPFLLLKTPEDLYHYLEEV